MFECIYIPAIRGGNKELTQIETQHFLNTTRNFLVARKRLKNIIANEIAESIEATHNKIKTIFNESINNIQEMLPESNNLSLKFPSFDQVITSILGMTKISTREGTSLTSENEGTGFQSLISLGLLELITEKSQANNKILLIEEPEAFLHPQYQRSIANQMSRMSEKAQTIVTTHSSIMIDQFPISKIIRISRNRDGLEVNWKERSKVIDRLNHYCDTKNSELIFSEKTILVEGRSDKLVIESILQEIVDKNHHMNNISVIDCDGSGIEHISTLADSLGVHNLIILDKDMFASQDKRMLIRICENKKMKLTEKELQKLNEIKEKSRSIKSIREVFELRNNANAIFESRNIYTLISDIEGSIVSSFTKQKILTDSRSNSSSHLNAENIKELTVLSGYPFLKRAYELFGSKGGEVTKAMKDNKPKPHVMNDIFKSIGSKNAIKDSDTIKLKETLEAFIN